MKPIRFSFEYFVCFAVEIRIEVGDGTSAGIPAARGDPIQRPIALQR
jgi:hypothetical protein